MSVGARTLLAVVAIAIVAGPAWVSAQNEKIRRVAPPKFSKGVTDTFAIDPKSNLSGERPAFTGGAATMATPMTGGPATAETPVAVGAGGPFVWSKVIEADALLQEIKSLKGPVAEDSKTLAHFKGRGAKNLRRNFTVLAMAFNIIAEYDKDAKWKNQALSAREVFGKAGMNAKVATDQSYNESKARNKDLESILNGETIDTPPNIDPKQPWSKIVSRPPLMMRLEAAKEERLGPWISNKDEFTKNLEAVAHEAQIVAAIGEVIKREGFENSDDDTYKEYATAMQAAALEIVEAIKSKNYDAARAAQGKLSKACADCHSGFRS